MLFPSPMSDEFSGLQMVSTLNGMNGNVDAYDSRMFAVFGNHELDKSELSEVGILESAVQQSNFEWLASNITFSNSEKLSASSNIASHRMVRVNGINVGLFGLTTNVKVPDYAQIDEDYVSIARKSSKLLRDKGADVVIALTHLSLKHDRKVLGLMDDGPDIIFGGHEHHRVIESINGRFIVKADADALSAAVAEVKLDSSGLVSVDVEHRILDGSVAPDLYVSELVDDWKRRYVSRRCQSRGLGANCTESILGHTAVNLVAEELYIRRFETNFGNWIADAAIDAFSDNDAQIAFLNSGGLRLNQNIVAGSPIEERHLDSLLPYSTELVLIEITGAELQKIVSRSVEGWSGNGWWLQIGGFAFEHIPSKEKAGRLMLISKGGLIPVKPEQIIRAVTTRYLLDPATGQDGYTFLGESSIISSRSSGIGLKRVIKNKLLKEPEISAMLQGRVCNREYSTPCIFDSHP